jgi:trans-2,3-dihydro-3-hydroxyanthranilate isomerase
MRHRYFVADVFTDRPLEGNPLAVFTDGGAVPEALMQPIARELNLSETVFLSTPQQGGNAKIRIFTPRIELLFAGHPILGTAFVLAALDPGKSSVRLETGAGIVTVNLEREGDSVRFGRFEQPAPSWRLYPETDALFGALGVAGSGLPVDFYDNGPGFVYVELGNEGAVAALRPDLKALETLLGPVGVNCFAGSGRKWKSRMFAPGAGVSEDPATGSAAGPLALHLARHQRNGFGDEIEISQGREIGRPSVLYATAFGTANQPERLAVGGKAVVVAEGGYRID